MNRKLKNLHVGDLVQVVCLEQHSDKEITEYGVVVSIGVSQNVKLRKQRYKMDSVVEVLWGESTAKFFRWELEKVN